MPAATATRPKKTPDRHKPRRMVALPLALATALESVAAEKGHRLNRQAVQAVTDYLVRLKRWPKV